MSDAVDSSLRGLDDCRCCEGTSAQTPVEVVNRPGLSAIAYRVGTYEQFRQSMFAQLSSSTLPELTGLRTREDDDFSIALLDAWAIVADVLRFYQERIANESYLRTATERLSLLQLAQLLGYLLRPGVAANTYLAFTIEDAKGAPGQATIDIGTKVQSIAGPGQLPQTFETVEKITAKAAWNALKPQTTQLVQPQSGATSVYLLGTTTGLKPGDGILFVGSEREQDVNSERWVFRQVTAVTPDTTNGRTLVTWVGGLGSASTDLPAMPEIYTFRKRAALFGSNAPDVRTLPDSVLTNYHLHTTTRRRASEWNFGTLGSPFNLDTTYPGIVKDSWIVLSDPLHHELYRVNAVLDTSQHNYTLVSKTTQITPDTVNHLDRFGSPRGVVVFAQSEKLELAETPITPTPLQAGHNVIHLLHAATDLQAGQKLIVSGMAAGVAASDPAISEVILIRSVSPNGMTITLSTSLQNSYDPTTVSINANVALATHGETVANEVLGSGDASQAYQRSPLRQKPLTYTSSSTANGTESTLHVRINDIEWHEVPTLYGHGRREHIFVTSTDDDQKTSIGFGDGITGARPPRGQENIRATYRKGIGLAGMVKAGQLSLLMTRPLGVKSVTNPLDASGAADPEGVTDARCNVPLTVLTLGRIVSLQDYEDFARAFAGIAKSLASWAWIGQSRRVFVTVAGANGSEVPPDSELYRHLLLAMQQAGDPYVPLSVQSYRKALFRVAASVKVDADYRQEGVLGAVEQALRSSFAFEARAFGQPVTLSKVMAVMPTNCATRLLKS